MASKILSEKVMTLLICDTKENGNYRLYNQSLQSTMDVCGRSSVSNSFLCSCTIHASYSENNNRKDGHTLIFFVTQFLMPVNP